MTKISVDTDLIRLLPRTSRASKLTVQLKDIISDGGYFSVALEQENRKLLLDVVEIFEDLIVGLSPVLSNGAGQALIEVFQKGE